MIFLVFLKDMECVSAVPGAVPGATSAAVGRSACCLKRLKSSTNNTVGPAAVLAAERTLVTGTEDHLHRHK